MAKRVDISLLKGGDEIVSSQILTDHLSLDGLDVDGLRLQGFDNYMIEERRAKVSVQLARYNEKFNKTLVDAITNPKNRIYDYFEQYDDSHISAYVFSDKIALDATKDTDLFKRELIMPETMMQNRSDNVLTVQSKVMMDMFLTMMDRDIVQNANIQHSGNCFNGMSYNPNTISLGVRLKRKHGNTNVYFNNMLAQTLAFIYHGMKIEYSGCNPKTQFKIYINGIRGGLGDGIEALISRPSSHLGWIFFPFIIFAGNNRFDNILKYDVIPKIYQYFYNNNWSISVPDGREIDVANIGGTIYDKQNFVFAAFLASIIKYDWYVSVKDDFFRKNMDISKCIDDDLPFGYVPYIPFYRAMEVVRRKNSNRPNDNPYNIFLPWIGDAIGNVHEVGVLPYSMLRYENACGKAQRKTSGDDTVGWDDNNDSRLDDEGLFIPVKRKYELKWSPFGSIPQYAVPVESIIDTLNYGTLIGNIGNNFICLTHYESTNWMFRDNIKVQETYAPDGGYTDMIPILRDGSGSIVQSHKDAFNKIYQAEYSNLMDIRLEIKVDSKLVYTGWIDYTTIEISGGRLSFTATDAIGVLIENLDKLGGVIYFSQFDKGGKLVADKRAGHVILDFINRMAYNPIPYKPLGWKPVNNLLDAPRGSILNNKVLDDISPTDAFLIALQASQRVLYANGDGSLALDNISKYPDDEIPAEDIIVLDNKYISEKALSFGIDTEEFNEEHLVKLAGNQSILEDVIKFFNRNKSDTQKTLSITTTQDFDKDVKLLDTIELDGELWTINEIEYMRM